MRLKSEIFININFALKSTTIKFLFSLTLSLTLLMFGCVACYTLEAFAKHIYFARFAKFFDYLKKRQKS